MFGGVCLDFNVSAMGHSDISVTMNTYAQLESDDTKDQMVRLEELEADKKEAKKLTGDNSISQKMFKMN